MIRRYISLWMRCLLFISVLVTSTTAYSQTDSTTNKHLTHKQIIVHDFNALKDAPTSDARKDSLKKIIDEKIDGSHLSEKQKARLHKRHTWLQGIDNWLTRRYRSTKNFDTLYLARPDESLTIKARANISGMGVLTKGNTDGIKYRSHMTTDLSITAAVSVIYQGLGFGFSFNPMKLAGKKKDMEFNVNAYYNRWGVDVIYQDSKTMNGYIETNGTRADIHRGDLKTRVLNINGYYAFNYRRFSFPSAFTQSYIQKKSAGSFLLGFSFLGGVVKTAKPLNEYINSFRIYTGHFSIGGGYGYNLVLPHRWMLHGSFLPTVVVFNANNTTRNGVKKKAPFHFPDFILAERLSLVHYFTSRFFMSYTAVLTNSVFGNPKSQSFVHNKWRVRGALGWRL